MKGLKSDGKDIDRRFSRCGDDRFALVVEKASRPPERQV
jgi:hypothetical protein